MKLNINEYINIFCNIGQDHICQLSLFDSFIQSGLVNNYPLAQQSCGGDIGSVPYVCM